MSDLFTAAAARFAVGQPLIAKARFGDEIKTKSVTVMAIRQEMIYVEAADGTMGRFNLQGEHYCPVTGQMNTWLETE